MGLEILFIFYNVVNFFSVYGNDCVTWTYFSCIAIPFLILLNISTIGDAVSVPVIKNTVLTSISSNGHEKPRL